MTRDHPRNLVSVADSFLDVGDSLGVAHDLDAKLLPKHPRLAENAPWLGDASRRHS